MSEDSERERILERAEKALPAFLDRLRSRGYLVETTTNVVDGYIQTPDGKNHFAPQVGVTADEHFGWAIYYPDIRVPPGWHLEAHINVALVSKRLGSRR